MNEQRRSEIRYKGTIQLADFNRILGSNSKIDKLMKARSSKTWLSKKKGNHYANSKQNHVNYLLR